MAFDLSVEWPQPYEDLGGVSSCGCMKDEKNGSAKAERQNKGGTEQEDVQCVEVEGPDWVGFVGQGKDLEFLPSVGC